MTTEHTKEVKVVMCVGTWPEDNYTDFEVTEVKENETEESAIDRAKFHYGKDNKYYIKKQRTSK